MAILAELFVLFKGDDSQLSKDMDTAKGKVGGFASNATALLGGAVAGAAVAAGAAILAIGKGALDVSVDTQTAAGSMAASLGIPIAEAEKFAEVAKRVYGNNFADSVGDAATAVEALAKTMGLAADDPALQDMAENAFRLRDTFGTDVNESISAAQTLVENFGISGQEAFDLIAAGNQKGLDRSGDFLDTINEYSTQFANGGASATQFFGMLESGLGGGMLGTDKAADAFKEFVIRIQDGSTLTSDSLKLLGLDSEAITAGLSNGTLTAADAFTMVQEALANTSDPLVQMQAGVGLIGTQFEDLGAKAATGLTLANDTFADSAGAVDSLDAKYNTFGGAVEGIWRRLTVSVSPFTDKLLGMVNDAMPAIMGAFDTFDASVGPIMEGVGSTIDTVVSAVQGFFGQFATSITDDGNGPLEYWKDWIDTNLPLVQTLFNNILSAIQGFWALFGDDIMRVTSNTFANIFLVIDTIMRNIGDVITLALQLLTGDWEGAWGTIQGIVERIWETITTIVGNQIDSLKTLFTSIDWGAVGSAIINGVKDGISSGWQALLDWFPDRLAELRNMLPFSEPKDSSSPLRGLGKSGQSLIKNFRAGMDDELANLNMAFSDGLSGLMGGLGSQPVAAGAGAGGFNITVYVDGNNANYEAGRAVGRGVVDEMRMRGE